MLSTRNYFSILLLFLVVFVMLMSLTVASDRLAASFVNDRAGKSAGAQQKDALLDNTFNDAARRSAAAGTAAGTSYNPQAAILSAGSADTDAAVLEEWCVYNKYRYRVFTALPAAAALAGYDVVLVGDVNIGSSSLSTLQQYAARGMPLVFTRLPAFAVLKADPALADFFGIRSCVSPSYAIDGVKIFADFFLSRERIYQQDDDYGDQDDMNIRIPYYTLRAGYQVYAVSILQHQGKIKNEALPALLWRTYTGSSDVFVVNSSVFSGERLLGIVTAFLSQAYEAYLYPVVNAQSLIELNYPCFSNENSDVIRKRYSSTTQGFCRDILLPNVVKILKNYGNSYNFFVSPQLDYTDTAQPLYSDTVLYWKEMKKMSGAVGLSLEQISSAPLADVLAQNRTFFGRALPQYRFTALYGGNFSTAQLLPALRAGQNSLLGDVTLVLSKYQEHQRLFQYITPRVLAVQATMNGYQHESMDDIQMLSFETALGLCVQQVDFSRALYPQGNADDWSKLARTWSSGKTYFNDFGAFDDASVYDLETRVRNFLAMNFRYRRTGDTIRLHIDHLRGSAWFVLRVQQDKVVQVTGGAAQKISDTAYRIQADQADVTIRLRQQDVLGLPSGRVPVKYGYGGDSQS